MRFAFWRRNEGDGQAERPKPVRAARPPAPERDVADIDMRSLVGALARRRYWIILPTLAVAMAALAVVNVITPRYKSEARILVEGRENVFLRPNGERSEERSTLDAEAVTSQVQLVLSRDLAREVIRKNRLSELPEFDAVLQGFSPVKSLLALFGFVRDPFRMTPEERVMDAYFERLQAYAVDKSRVIVVEFQSRDPELAARVADSIADGYLVIQQNARQQQAKSASQWLLGEIEGLRKKVAEAESRVEDFRSKSSLFIGTNNTSLSNQQMGELNTQLNNARALRSDAETKARLIREMIQGGKPIEASDVLNSELMRRLSEQRVTLRAQLAEQSSTLLDNHPRIKELKAQLSDLDRQIRDEAAKISRSLDNDARIAGGRVEALTASLEQMKKQASSSNGQDVQLRALEREAKAQRDLLESYLAKYREANARENIDSAPTEARIISRAIVSNTPAYPKKLPVVLIATFATLLLSSGLVVTGELLRVTAPVPAVGQLVRQVEEPFVVPSPALVPEPSPEPIPLVQSAARAPRAAPDAGELERIVAEFRIAGTSARKIVVLGTAASEGIAQSSLMLARLLSGTARVVLVDLAGTSLAIAAASDDPTAPGLAELIKGEASFARVITKDRLSRVHLIAAGRPGFDRTVLQSPRLGTTLSALLAAYDHVLIDAGAASDLPADLLAENARAVMVPAVGLSEEACSRISGQLQSVGFKSVSLLSQPVAPIETLHRDETAVLEPHLPQGVAA